MITIRTLTEHNATDFRSIRLRALQESPEAFASSYEDSKDEPLSTFAERIHPRTDFPERFVLGAFDQAGQLVGNAGLVRERGRKMQHKAMVWGMYVAPKMRSQGIGKMLMQNLIELSTTISGLEQLYLGVVTTNRAARQLYLLLGFRIYGVEPHALKLDELYFDEELMVLSLLK